MYSILVRIENITAERWKYLTDSEGEIAVYNTLQDAQTAVEGLLQTKILSHIKVVKNCTITDNITIEEVEID